MPPNKHTVVAEGQNSFLGKLLCYSCRKHQSFNRVDKVLLFHSNYYINIYPDGHLELVCESPEKELDQSQNQTYLNDAEKLNEKMLQPYGGGVTILFHGKRIECSSCGSEEFINDF